MACVTYEDQIESMSVPSLTVYLSLKIGQDTTHSPPESVVKINHPGAMFLWLWVVADLLKFKRIEGETFWMDDSRHQVFQTWRVLRLSLQSHKGDQFQWLLLFLFCCYQATTPRLPSTEFVITTIVCLFMSADISPNMITTFEIRWDIRYLGWEYPAIPITEG
jgi:hypothetical protein